MPPAIYVASDAGETGATSIAFQVPTTSKARDTLIAVLATAATNDRPDLDALAEDGWEELAELAGAPNSIWVLRRERQDGDQANLEIPFVDALADPAIGVLLVYRNLDTGAEMIGGSKSNIAASASFVCPSRMLERYSDLYVGIVLVGTNEVAITPPGGTTERIEYQADGLTLAVFDVLLEAVGASGTKTATAASPEDGIAASLAFAADALVGFGKSFTIEPIGAIGLPSRGV